MTLEFISELKMTNENRNPDSPTKLDIEDITHNEDIIFEPNHSRFSPLRRKATLVLLSCVGILSPLCSASYYPAISRMSEALSTSQEMVDLSISSFLFTMAVAPLLWGTIADKYGRRTPYLISMSLFVLASLGCALSTSIAMLISMRVLQGLGSSAAMSVSLGTLTDIYPREERGSAVGMFYIGPLLGPVMGPLLGGFINQWLGWRAIFWFITGLAIIGLLALALFLPETLNNPEPFPIQFTFKKPYFKKVGPIINPFSPLKFFRFAKVVLPVIYSSIIVVTFYYVSVSQSKSLGVIYNLSSAQIGLSYLPLGLGDLVGSTASGRVSYLTLRLARKRKPNPSSETRIIAIFPATIFILIGMIIAGWSLEKQFPIYVTIIAQFMSATFMAFAFGLISSYIIDLFPRNSTLISAVANLGRALSAGIVTSFNTTLIRLMGFGWAFSVLGLCHLMGFAIFLFLFTFGYKFKQGEPL